MADLHNPQYPVLWPTFQDLNVIRRAGAEDVCELYLSYNLFFQDIFIDVMKVVNGRLLPCLPLIECHVNCLQVELRLALLTLHVKQVETEGITNLKVKVKVKNKVKVRVKVKVKG